MDWFQYANHLITLSVLSCIVAACSGDMASQSIDLNGLSGKTMDEVIVLEGAPVERLGNQLLYEFDTNERVYPWWAATVLAGLAGSSSGTRFPDRSYMSRSYYCLILDFENNIYKQHTTVIRLENEGC